MIALITDQSPLKINSGHIHIQACVHRMCLHHAALPEEWPGLTTSIWNSLDLLDGLETGKKCDLTLKVKYVEMFWVSWQETILVKILIYWITLNPTKMCKWGQTFQTNVHQLRILIQFSIRAWSRAKTSRQKSGWVQEISIAARTRKHQLQ